MEERPIPSDDSPKKVGLFVRLRSTSGYVSFVFASVGLVALAGGGISYLLIEQIRNFSLTVVMIGGVLLLLSLMLSVRQVMVAVLGIRGRYGANTLIMIITFLGILIMVNFVSFLNNTRFDVTATKQFSLARQTVGILDDLDEPVQATAFYVPADPSQRVVQRQAADLLSEFARRSDKFTFRLVDPDAQPSIARQYEITSYRTIAFEATDSGRRYMVITPPVTEQDFTTALLVVTETKQKKIYYLIGHGERDPNDLSEGSQGYGFAVTGMLGDNYLLEPLIIGQGAQQEWQEDAALLVIAGPTSDLLEAEKQPLYDYLRNGGKALFLLEPDTPPSFKELLARWAISLGEGSIVDQGSSLQDDLKTPILQSSEGSYSPLSPITVLIDVSFFPGVTTVSYPVEEPPDTISFVPLAITSRSSWLETDVENIAFDEGEDVPGPEFGGDFLFVAVAVEAIAPVGEKPRDDIDKLTNMVIFGDADFASNRFYFAFSNSDFFLNAVNWLAEDFDLISIRVKPFIFRELVVTSSEFELIRWSSWFLMPVVLVFLASVVWWRRR